MLSTAVPLGGQRPDCVGALGRRRARGDRLAVLTSASIAATGGGLLTFSLAADQCDAVAAKM